MRTERDQADFVDGITKFAMRQSSRRGFIKWLGKGGLALAAGITGGLGFLSNAFASINCSQYYPGCESECGCFVTECKDPSNGKVFYCEGTCGCPSTNYYTLVFWYYSPSLNKCVQAKDCVLC